MKRFLLALGCAALALTSAAVAGEHRRGLVVSHSYSDTDGDGWMTRAEAAAAADRAFDNLDTDGDGRLTQADFDARFAALDREVEEALARADVEVERAHAQAREARSQARHARRQARAAAEDARNAERRVERIESRDGRVVERHVLVLRGDGAEDIEAPIPPVPPRAPRAPRLTGAGMFAHFEEADLDGDGALSREEFRAQQLRRFDADDANGDGRIRAPQPPAPPEAPVTPRPPR